MTGIYCVLNIPIEEPSIGNHNPITDWVIANGNLKLKPPKVDRWYRVEYMYGPIRGLAYYDSVLGWSTIRG